MERYGYIRVSTKEQNPERQIIAMQEQQISKKNIYIDKISGHNFDRPQYIKLLKKLKRGDILIVKSIDRLGRNYSEILEQWRRITKEIGADIQVIDMPLLNTNSFHEDLTGVFVSDLVLQILAYVAETERAFIKQRQAEGITAAKNRGVKFGCCKIEVPDGFERYYQMWSNGEISIRKAAQELDMNYTTFYRRCVERKEKDENNCCKL
jgi:DNA invertase Pin-like site-specific DNA recombinase